MLSLQGVQIRWRGRKESFSQSRYYIKASTNKGHVENEERFQVARGQVCAHVCVIGVMCITALERGPR